MTKEELESKITRNILALNELKKQPDYKDCLDYQKLKTIIAEQIWRFCETIEENYDYFEKVPEIINFIINKFVPNDENGIIKYITKALVKSIKYEKAKEKLIIEHGNLSEYEIKNIRKIEKWAEKYGLNLNKDVDVQKLSCLTGLSERVIKNTYLRINNRMESVDSNNNEKAIQIGDNNQYSSEDKLINKAELIKYLDLYEQIFNSKREWGEKKTKEYVSKLITRDLLKNIEKLYTIDFSICERLSKYKFIDKGLFESWQKGIKLPKQNEIAQEFGRDKTDASRTLRRFNAAIKKEE